MRPHLLPHRRMEDASELDAFIAPRPATEDAPDPALEKLEASIAQQTEDFVHACVRIGAAAVFAVALFAAVVLPGHADTWWP